MRWAGTGATSIMSTSLFIFCTSNGQVKFTPFVVIAVENCASVNAWTLRVVTACSGLTNGRGGPI